MSDNQECPHGLDPAWCSICLHPTSGNTPAPVVVAYRQVFAAIYEGSCRGCGHRIYPKQPIRRVTPTDDSESTLGYVHLGCES